jgi:hypothetical protein
LRLNYETDRLTIIIDHPPDAVAKDHDVEVDQQADTNIQQTKVREQLRVVNGMKCLFAFGLDYDTPFDDQVGSKAAFEFDAFIDEWNGLLALYVQSQFLQFVGEACFIRRLQETRPQLPMDLYCCANNFVGEVGASQGQKITAKVAKSTAKDAKKIHELPFWAFLKFFFATFAVSLCDLCG